MKKTYEQVIEECEAAAEAAGLSLDYDPAILVEDISAQTEEEWLESRKAGISGTGAGPCMGVGHQSKTELVLEKQGKLRKEAVDAGKQYLFDFGHQMEAALGNWFAATRKVNVFTDRRMYQHSLYPFMIGNMDGFCIDKEGYKCLLEFKTANPQMRYLWKSGILGEDAILFRPEYEWQVRHYMAIMNIYRAYIVVGFDNSADNIVVIQIDRDIQKEVSLINAEYNVWNNFVLKGTLPKEPTFSDDSYEALRPHEAARKSQEKKIPDEYKEALDEFFSLNTLKSQKNAEIKKIDERLNAIKIPLEEFMGSDTNAYMGISDTEEYSLTYNETVRDSIPSDALRRLKMEEPEIYEDFHKESSSRTLRITTRKPKKRA
jgi:predicted phage-related endonuclease